jgi:ribosomal protein L20A (L18A)
MKYLVTYITSAGNETHRDVEAATETEAKELVLSSLGARYILTVKIKL